MCQPKGTSPFWLECKEKATYDVINFVKGTQSLSDSGKNRELERKLPYMDIPKVSSRK